MTRIDHLDPRPDLFPAAQWVPREVGFMETFSAAHPDDALAGGDDGFDLEDECGITDMLGTGASYRQLDHWWRCGYFLPEDDPDRAVVRPGSGRPRVWTGRHLAIADLMLRCIRSGIIVSVAARIAVKAVDQGAEFVTTGEGIRIEWQPRS